MNILEDHRIEKLWGEFHPGSARWFIRNLQKYYEELAPIGLCDTMVTVRGEIPEKADPKWRRFVPTIQKALEMVERTTSEGTYRVSQWFWEQMKNYVEEEKKRKQGKQGKSQKGLEGTEKRQSQLSQFSKQEGDSQEEKDSSSEKQDSGAQEGAESDLQTPPDFDIKDPLADEEQNMQGFPDNLNKQHNDSKWGKQNINEASLANPNLQDMLDQARGEIEEYLDRIAEKLSEGPIKDDKIEDHVKGRVSVDDFSISNVRENGGQASKLSDTQIARKMRVAFEQIRKKYRKDYDVEGATIDPEEFILWKINGKQRPPEFFEVDETEAGFTMHIYVDCSGSMGGTPLQAVKQAVATIMEATENMPKVTIELFGWSASYGQPLHIQRATNHFEVSLLRSTGNTPTDLALQYATERMVRERADSKFILFFTDGYPTYSYPEYIGDAYCKNAIAYGKRRGIKYYGILAEDYSWGMGRGQKFMNKVFGAQHRVLKFQGAVRLMEKIIKEAVIEEMKRMWFKWELEIYNNES